MRLHAGETNQPTNQPRKANAMTAIPTLYLIDEDALEPVTIGAPFVAPLSAHCTGDGPYCVLYSPWERQGRIVSRHATASAAIRAARKERREFRRQNPNGYGHTWDVCVRPGGHTPPGDGHTQKACHD